MDIAKLESFLTLAKTQHFAKAADKLYISQPALSKRIRALEDELGIPLFDRMGNKTFLTIHGETFRPFAENMVATCNSAKEYIRQIENMEHGVLNFGATNFIGVYMLPAVIARFHKKHPNITINMNINTSQTILEMLHKNQLEFVFLSDYIIEDPENYVIEQYWQDYLKLVVGTQHPLFSKKAVPFLMYRTISISPKRNSLLNINFWTIYSSSITLTLKISSLSAPRTPLKRP